MMYRAELGSTFIVAKGFGQPYLVLYPMAEWEDFISRIDALGMDAAMRDLKRYIMRNAVPTEADAQGRIVISKAHREYAGLVKNVLVLGMGSTVEIWDADTIDEKVGDEPENMEAMLAQISGGARCRNTSDIIR